MEEGGEGLGEAEDGEGAAAERGREAPLSQRDEAEEEEEDQVEAEGGEVVGWCESHPPLAALGWSYSAEVGACDVWEECWGRCEAVGC